MDQDLNSYFFAWHCQAEVVGSGNVEPPPPTHKWLVLHESCPEQRGPQKPLRCGFRGVREGIFRGFDGPTVGPGDKKSLAEQPPRSSIQVVQILFGRESSCGLGFAGRFTMRGEHVGFRGGGGHQLL